MQIRVVGSNMDVGQALTSFVEEHLEKEVMKYFDRAIKAEVHFSKEKHHQFKVLITINEGVKSGIIVKSNAEAGDPYACFTESLKKAVNQLRRYKDRIKNYRRVGGGIKNTDQIYQVFEAKKYVIPPLPFDLSEEINEEENNKSSIKIIEEKNTEIETLTSDEAVMKMDLADLPALVFVNKDNGRLNMIYHRKDGNISLIDIKK